MKTAVVIVHYGPLATTKSCIDSLLTKDPDVGKIIVVNNNVSNISAADFADKNIIVLNNGRNLGFAGGVNKGITYALSHGTQEILLLNNDTLVKGPFLKQLRKDFESNSKLGIVGPAISFKKGKKTVYDLGGDVDFLFGRTSHTEVAKIEKGSLSPVTYVTGAAMLIRRDIFEKIGLFDDTFFLYYEDVDFCLRAQKAGFSVAVNASVCVYHLLSKTIGKVNPFAVFHQTRSAVVFGKKYMKGFFPCVAHWSFLLAQTTLITLKSPQAGIAGWKALFAA